MCVLSIKMPIRKKSGNLSYAPRISNVIFTRFMYPRVGFFILFFSVKTELKYVLFALFFNAIAGPIRTSTPQIILAVVLGE